MNTSSRCLYPIGIFRSPPLSYIKSKLSLRIIPRSKVLSNHRNLSQFQSISTQDDTIITRKISKFIQPFPSLSSLINNNNNSLIQSSKENLPNGSSENLPNLPKDSSKQLIYIGPHSAQVLAYRLTSLVFLGIGAIGIPGLLSSGSAPISGTLAVLFSVIGPVLYIRGLTKNYVTRMYIHLPSNQYKISPLFDQILKNGRDPRDLLGINPNTKVTIEIYTGLGELSETTLRLKQLLRKKRLRGLEHYTWYIPKEEYKNAKGKKIHKRFYVDGPIFSKPMADMSCKAIWACIDNGIEGVRQSARQSYEDILTRSVPREIKRKITPISKKPWWKFWQI